VRSRYIAIVLSAAGCIGAGAPAGAADPDALWKIVSGKCVPNQQEHGAPAPCAEVDLTGGVDRGYAVLKDLIGDSQFLLIPTARVSGIESPELLAAEAPNYFAAAWRARRFTAERLHRDLPRDMTGLAVNSTSARSQNQLHIHIDCIRADVRAALQRHRNALGDTWAPFPEPLAGEHYRAMRVLSDDLDGAEPFKLLAVGLPDAAAMAAQTLVAIGAAFADNRPGFILLTDHTDPVIGDRASGEDLEDHACALAHP
jgi:CDP-diacylglycerol pyrophosphatase